MLYYVVSELFTSELPVWSIAAGGGKMAGDEGPESWESEIARNLQMINVSFQGHWYVLVPSFFSKSYIGQQLRCRFCFAFPVKKWVLNRPTFDILLLGKVVALIAIIDAVVEYCDSCNL